MKNLKKYSLVIVALLFAIACHEDHAIQKTGRIEFSFVQKDANSGGRTMGDVHSVMISVKNSNGSFVYERKKIPLIKFGNEFLSEPVSLTTGNFQLTEFIILDENDIAIYATPLEGSPLAYLVADPLPMAFTVTKDQTTKVIPEVIGVNGGTAADFGYATFAFNLVKTFKFSIGVLAYNDQSSNFQLTASHLTITSSSQTIFDKDLTAITNEIIVKDDLSGYHLKVTKQGYLTYEKDFTAAELKGYTTSISLVVTLLKETLAQGLIAYYPFNGNANDQTANHFNGIVHESVLATDRKGNVNSAYSFDGLNDYISVPHNNALNLPSDFTISLWVNVAAIQEPHEGINDILRKWNGNAEGYPFSISYLNPLAADDVEDKIIYVRYDGQACGHGPTTFSPTITNDTFIHIVLIKEGGVLRHYLNNTMIAEITDTATCNVGNTADMTIGCRGNLVRFFKGKIDDIRIYSRALTAAEVGNLFGE